MRGQHGGCQLSYTMHGKTYTFELFDHWTTLQTLCKLSNRWGMYISTIDYWETDKEEIKKASPYLSKFMDSYQDTCQTGFDPDEGLYMLFDTEEECENTFNATIGDDGPNEINDYDGPFRIFAITCSPNGEFINENT